ncbi:MAG: methyltransferase domain-containing protein [Nitrospira sp. SB0672_bin_25]|nr:methyltransferase domain-containing protein [Nitrospira sp. SB0666_bin_27]MYF24402.1 methyltransferase domain-containing protein [Nitrospira sp. SB0678_bin_10]MYJ53990.1 methyltransferase domain-containing protein [Nitrospira sp. SB0672_bin_25]
MTQAPAPSPILFFETAFAIQRTCTIRAAVDLEVFTAIKEGHNTASALADRCKASERGLRMLADYLVMLGFLTKSENTYALTQDSEVFLVKTSPAYLGGTLEFLLSPTLFEGFCDLTAAVRQGGTTLPDQGTIAEEHPEWVTFARAMVPMMIGPAKWIAEHLVSTGGTIRKVMDVAAGHGVFGVEIAKRFPDAEVIAVDWPNVLTVARENADAASLGDRYHTIAGSAFDVDLGEGYDLVLLTNFLHHFAIPECEDFLRKVRDAMAPGGRVITLEFVPNDDRVSPASADFALIMLVTTPAGDAYTFKEWDAMFQNAGFGRSELLAVPNNKEHVIITHLAT